VGERDAGSRAEASAERRNATANSSTSSAVDAASVRAFAGPDPDVAVVPPAARQLLARFDQRSAHYETVIGPL